jgi:hypothetical protein
MEQEYTYYQISISHNSLSYSERSSWVLLNYKLKSSDVRYIDELLMMNDVDTFG